MSKPLMSKTQNICLVLLTILFVILGCIMINNLLKDKDKNDVEYHEIDVNDKVVVTAMAAWEHSMCGNISDLVNLMYNGKFNIETIDNYLLLYLSLETFDTIPTCTLANETVKIPLEDINTHLSNIVDRKIILSNNDIINIINEGMLGQIYDLKYENNILTVAKVCSSCDNRYEGIIVDNINAKMNDTKLVVYQKFAYGVETKLETNDFVIDYYKDIEKRNFVERLSQVDAGKLNWDEYNTYEFTFKIDGEYYKLMSIVNE